MLNKRNYGIDLLRLVCMYLVCILHVLGQGGVLNSSELFSTNYKVFWFMEIIAYGAVDAFALISGYMYDYKELKPKKLINMWFQVFFYSFIITFIAYLLGRYELTTHALSKLALPVTYNAYWYFTAYFGLFFFIPFLGNYIKSLDDKTAKKILVIFFLLFSIIGMVNDSFTTSVGYSMVWLIILFCIGALAKKVKLFEKKKTRYLLLIYFICNVANYILFTYYLTRKFISYISPLVLIPALILVIVFSRIKLNGIIISKLAPLAFGVYLFQLNPYIWEKVMAFNFSFIPYNNLFVGFCAVIFFSFIIFVAGLLVEFIRKCIWKLIRFDKITEQIERFIKFILNKVILILN